MQETKAGLPNTCSQCGANPGATWYARHNDAARSGQGLCKSCAFPEEQPTAVGDDLTVINGLGEKMAQRLAEQFQITTFQQLAAANAGELAAALPRISAKQVEAWQAEAAVLAQAETIEGAE